MRMITRRDFLKSGVVFLACLGALSLTAPSFRAAEPLPGQLGDAAFWRMVSDFSEEGGYFRFENFLSNELAFQQVIPTLKETTKAGGVYLGVGPEQNFTYITALQPKIAFVIDIRRQNMLEHLMYKAIFELSDNRPDFVSVLFSRKRPDGLNNRSTAEDLFLAYRKAQPDEELFNQNVRAIMDNLLQHHHYGLSTDDQNGIKYVYKTFFNSG